MKTGAICDIEYFMRHGCRGCKLSRLCAEKEKRDSDKNDKVYNTNSTDNQEELTKNSLCKR